MLQSFLDFTNLKKYYFLFDITKELKYIITSNEYDGEMAEYGRRRSPAKRVYWETGIEGSNPSLSVLIFPYISISYKFYSFLFSHNFPMSTKN